MGLVTSIIITCRLGLDEVDAFERHMNSYRPRGTKFIDYSSLAAGDSGVNTHVYVCGYSNFDEDDFVGHIMDLMLYVSEDVVASLQAFSMTEPDMAYEEIDFG